MRIKGLVEEDFITEIFRKLLIKFHFIYEVSILWVN